MFSLSVNNTHRQKQTHHLMTFFNLAILDNKTKINFIFILCKQKIKLWENAIFLYLSLVFDKKITISNKNKYKCTIIYVYQ
jgi:hypothetical protein